MLFGEALQRGLAAHRRTAATRRDVEKVLARASSEASEAVGVQAGLRFELAGRAMVASLPTGARETLAEVDIGDFGFTVTLRWEDRLEHALDLSSFEVAITALLESPATGDKIARLLAGAG